MDRDKQVVKSLLEWHKENRRDFPWRNKSDPYSVLIAEFFLQRTPAKRVAEIYPDFIRKYSTPRSLTIADPKQLRDQYRILGLEKRMAWLIDAMKIVCEEYEGEIPHTKELLLKLPGIGEYTASAILCFAFKQDIEIVDANVTRFYTRLYGVDNKIVKLKARSMVPDENGVQYNEALLDFSSLICKKRPLCGICTFKDYCIFSQSLS